MNASEPTLLLEPSELNALIQSNANLLLVAVCQAAVFQHKHIPGSVLVEPSELVSGIKPAVGKIPDEESLSLLFSRIGLTPEKRVIVYDDEGGGWAGRLIWTLDVIGHSNYSYLNGGLIAWLKSGYPIAAGSTINGASNYKAKIDTSQLRDKEFILNHLLEFQSHRMQIWDARSEQEYLGEKVTALRNGHIPGAKNLDWLELMDRDDDLRILSVDRIKAKLAAHDLRTGLPTITHCQTHHRSGLTYLVGKLLGMDIAAYDGSWSEWGNEPDTPVAVGEES